jgi:PAS domain S-box-containing protein
LSHPERPSDASDRTRALLSMMEDLQADRKRLADEIEQRRRAEEFARSIIDSALDAIIVIDDSGAIIEWNPQAEKIFGWNRGEVMGRFIADTIIPVRFRDAHQAGLKEFLETGAGPVLNQRLELTAVRRSGEEFPIELTVSPTQTANRWRFSAFLRDITERKRHEQLFRTTVESAPTAMVMIDVAGSIVLVNMETEKLFGYPRDELLGQPVELLVPYRFRERHPELRNGFFSRPLARRMGAGRDLFGVRKDGREFPVEIGLNPVETDEGLFVLSAIADITERKRLEEAMRYLNEELESRVRERTASLAQSNAALEESNVELQQFAYIASHDLQTPLRGITGFAQFLQRDYQGKLDKTADQYIGLIVNGAQRMQRLITDLLAYSRLESRAFASIDLADVFDDAVSLLRAEIEDVGGEATHGEMPTVVGDPAQLSQLLQNLIGNALKFHGDNPPQVHVACERNIDDVYDLRARQWHRHRRETSRTDL